MYNIQPYLPAFVNPVADVFLDDFSLEEVANRVSSLCTESNLIRLSGLLLAGVQMGMTSALIGGSIAFFLSSAVAVVVTASAFKVAQNYEAYCQLPLVYRAQLSAFQMIFGDFDDVAALNERARNLCVAIRGIENNNYAGVRQLVDEGAPLNLPAFEGGTPLQVALMDHQNLAEEFLALDHCQVSSEELNLVLYRADAELLNLALPKFQGDLSPQQEEMVQGIQNHNLGQISKVLFLIRSYTQAQQVLLPFVSEELNQLLEAVDFSIEDIPFILIAVREVNEPELNAHVERLFAEALHRALDQHNEDLALGLAHHGAGINVSINNIRPIQKAISQQMNRVTLAILRREDYVLGQEDVGMVINLGNQQAIEFLIDRHAWQLSVYQLNFLLKFMHFRGICITSIYLILRGEENMELLRRELEVLRGQYDRRQHDLETVCKVLFNAYVSWSENILDLCEEIFPELMPVSRLYYAKRKLSNVFGMHEGCGTHQYSWSLISKQLFSSYFREFPNEFSNEVVQAMEVIHQQQPVAEKVEKILNGDLVVLMSGWNMHAISIVMYKGWIIVDNRGAECGVPGLKVYRYQRERLLESASPRDSALCLLKMLMSDNKDYLISRNDGGSLHSDLGMEEIFHVRMKGQKVGNCGWIAFKSAVYAAEIAVQAYSRMEERGELDDVAFRESAIQVRPKYKALSQRLRQSVVESEYPLLKQSPYTDPMYLELLEDKIQAKGLRLPNANLAPADQS